MRKAILALMVVTGFLASGVRFEASILGDIVKKATGVEVDVIGGRMTIEPPRPQELPQAIVDNVKSAPDTLANLTRDIFNPAGVVLASAIRNAEGQARHGARTIPASVRRDLTPFFPAEVLDGALWTTVDGAHVNFGDLTIMWNNSANAITVNTVIIFRDGQDGTSNSVLWAHELVHVTQYRQLGVETFAHLYLLSGGRGMEDPAYEYEDFVEQKLKQGTNQSTRFYEYAPGYRVGATTAVSPAAIQLEARRVLPASACLDIVTNAAGQRFATNRCHVPLYLHDYLERHLYTGQVVPGICVPTSGLTCVLEPLASRPLITQGGGCVEMARYSFFQQMAGTPAVYRGNCVSNTGSQLGNSCCMFAGGKCGPFPGQPYPVGSSCMCNYSIPQTAGTVCLP